MVVGVLIAKSIQRWKNEDSEHHTRYEEVFPIGITFWMRQHLRPDGYHQIPMITLFEDGHPLCTVKETERFAGKVGLSVGYDFSTEIKFSEKSRYELRKEGMIPIRVIPAGYSGSVSHAILRHEGPTRPPENNARDVT